MRRVLAAALIALVLIFAAGSAGAEGPLDQSDQTAGYKPPLRGAPAARVGGASRGMGAQSPTQAARRIALVVGNDAYQFVHPLQNAAADARDLGRVLSESGFEATVVTNVKRREFYQLIDAFAAKIAASPDTVGLFFYAGHGIQANGKNYLIPVDADLATEGDLEADAVDAGKMLRAMDEARNAVNIVILDACRDNPLPKGRSVSRGLGTMHAPQGTFIGYAAAPGQTAQDGATGTNGVFTASLMKQMTVPGLTIEDVFKRTMSGVQQNTSGKQVPWMESSLQGNFYFVAPKPEPGAAAASAEAAPPGGTRSTDFELLFWQTIANSTNPADFEEYLRQYKEGRFAGLAKNRIASLQRPAPASTDVVAMARTLSAPVVAAPPTTMPSSPSTVTALTTAGVAPPAAAPPPPEASPRPEEPGVGGKRLASNANQAACTPGARLYVWHDDGWEAATVKDRAKENSCRVRLDGSSLDVVAAPGDKLLPWSLDGPGVAVTTCKTDAIVVVESEGAWYPAKIIDHQAAAGKCTVKSSGEDGEEDTISMKRIRSLD